MHKIYRSVPVSERLPEEEKYYLTNKGIAYFNANKNRFTVPVHSWREVTYWLEEIELPTEEDINYKYPINERQPFKTMLNVGCRSGAKFIINHIKGEQNEKI